MFGATTLTITGNLTSDPEIKFFDSGVAVANFIVGNNTRVQDRATGEWRNGDPLFLRCSIWRKPAENVVDSLKRGMRVVVRGRLRQRTYENANGERRTVMEMAVEDIGPSLLYATATVATTTSPPAPDSGREDVVAATADDPWSGQPSAVAPPF